MQLFIQSTKIEKITKTIQNYGRAGSGTKRCSVVSQQEKYNDRQFGIQDFQPIDAGIDGIGIHNCDRSTVFWSSNQM